MFKIAPADLNKRYEEAKRSLRAHLKENPKYLNNIIHATRIDRKHFLAALKEDDEEKRSPKYKEFVIDLAEHNLTVRLFNTLQFAIGAHENNDLYAPFCGRYKYLRFYPNVERKFKAARGDFLIQIVDGMPMFFHKSDNITDADCIPHTFDGATFFYEHRGAVIKNGNNIFCIGSRQNVIRSLIFQPPKLTARIKTTKDALQNSPCRGLLLSVLTTSNNPFSALTLLYHETYDKPIPKLEDEELIKSIFKKMAWSPWGFMFGNESDCPPYNDATTGQS